MRLSEGSADTLLNCERLQTPRRLVYMQFKDRLNCLAAQIFGSEPFLDL